MTETHWILLYAIGSGLFGRIVKLVPSIPKGALPWLVLAAGYAISFGMGVHGGLSATESAMAAWTGLAAGLVAIGGHEALKPALSRVLGDELAGKLLGKLPQASPKTERGTR